ncbi:MAG TPA: radical SAM protein [Candidatus Mediterraneibacter gallistercoris]|uniref:Radical SAM protein n=1 Tax=Candidatus Mediterraneibacter gallistercoris TaxID=2838671 RepID=A0A9D2T1T6_9FIRM|nr:radical SAM protein [Candidatus Mediterraneibacter gallistercoris]
MDFDQTNEKTILLRGKRLQRPVSGTLELLPLCNMACDMCYVHRSLAEVEALGGLRPIEDWIRLGKEMANAGVLFLMLTGGEPLLFPNFQELYLELKQLGMILTVNTNGTLINETWADLFGKYKPRRINVTLYGSDNETYEELCHYPNGFSRTLYGIQLLRERGVDVKINGSMTRVNRKNMDAIYQIGRNLSVPVHMDTYMLPGLNERDIPFNQQSRLSPEEAAVADVYAQRMEKSPELFWKYVETKISQTEENNIRYPDQLTCLAGNCSFAINWLGKMRPCVTFDEPAVSVFELGFEEAWHTVSQKSKEIKLSETCVKCTLRPLCKVCVASSFLETGNYDGVPEYLCRYAEEMLRLLKEEMSRNMEAESDAV